MMMSGIQTARAVRAHIMAHSALMSVLTDNLDESDVNVLNDAYKKAMDSELNQSHVEELCPPTSLHVYRKDCRI